MNFWFLLLLGLITYWMVQRSVARITTTPVWLLWLVLMTPALIWTGWVAVYGGKAPLPRSLMLLPWIVCPILYWVLVQWGRKPIVSKEPENNQTSQANPIPEPVPLRPIEATEEAQLRNCFSLSTYYLQTIEYKPQAIICRGQLRTKPETAYEKIKENIEGIFGDRFLVIFQEGLNDKPFFVLVPNSQSVKWEKVKPEKLTRPGLALMLLAATLLTTTFVGTRLAGVNFDTLQTDPTVLLKGIPYALTLMFILGVHELGHYFTARRYKIRTTLPYFIPMPFFLGTFGAFIQMRSPVPHRKALFDVSLAGPLAGFIVTVPLLLWGLSHSQIVPLTEDRSGLLNPEALNPKYSILLAIFAKIALGSQLTAQTAIDLHPVAVAACLGLIVTALNLMPVGQLDGGHIIHAMLGQRIAIFIGQIARLLLLLLSLVQPGFFLWAIMLLFIPLMDEPALNDVSELDNKRDILGVFSMALLVLIILPLPQIFAQLLQI
ncbi:site-2 protease family protein [Calothrix sp. 336/3]|uniref:site-2 protease family protein n=1 Tax=Calothrix sp. 336/3 TaxID=1337936 RepID=UPI0004E4351D|nr:site-2 protease family protein [Calothrix sp. 336/3]AKG22882.1 peptidase M50 [Calothrix sp. 336/3]